ncbi:MAG TPA: restriction endonuclease subunit S [Fermentimonas sp.]|nr:restriction endonuclease subunit S [Fermentimonas sp.]
MKEGWITKEINTACEVEYGTRVVRKRDGGTIYPVYGGGGATFFMDIYNREDALVIARFAMSEECTRFVEGKFFLNDSGLTVTPKNADEILPEFLNLQMLFLNDYIYSLSRGAAQRNLNVPAFRKTLINYPESLDEQHRIVSILDHCFKAIDKAKANAEQNLQNAKELFESYLENVFEESNGEIIELNKITEVKDGTHDSPKYVKEGIPFVTQKNIRLTGLTLEDTKFINDVDHEKFYKRSNVAFGDILISMIGANRGMAAIVDNEIVFSIKNVGLIKSNKNINNRYLLHYLLSRKAQQYVKDASSGGAQEFIGLTKLRAFPIPIVSIRKQNDIVSKLDALQTQTQELQSYYQTKIDDLEELKKSILQKAFAGELKTEKMVEEMEEVEL